MDNVENALNRIAQTMALLRSMIDGGEAFTEASRLAYQSAMKDIEWIKSLQ